MESWEAIAISQALRLGQFWHACNMPLTAHRHVNGKPLKIGINWRKFVPFHPLDLQKTVFVKALFEGAGRVGSIAAAVRVAKYGTPTSTSKAIGNLGCQLLQRQDVKDAMREYGATILHSG